MNSIRVFEVALVSLAAFAFAGCAGEETQTEQMQLFPPSSGAKEPAASGQQPPPAPRETPSYEPGGQTTVRMELPTGQKAGSAVLVERSAPKEVLVGKEFDYETKLTNITEKRLEGVILTGVLPENFKVTSTRPEARIAEGMAVWDVGELGPGESKTFLVRGSATQTGALLPCAQITYKNPRVCLTIRAVQPALKIDKTMPAAVILCDVLISTITVTNTGSGNASNVKVTDTLPAGMKTLDGQSVTVFEAGTLGPGQSRAFTVRAKADKPGQYTNKAVATADDGLRAEAAAKTVVRQPVLTVTKTGPEVRFVGRLAEYTITVTNKGDAPARNTVLTDTLPTNAEFVSASRGARRADNKVIWDLGDIEPNASKEVSLTLKATTIGVVRNVAAATADCAEASEVATTTVKGISAILLECVDKEDPIEVGSTVTYVIRVTNQGSSVGTNIVIQCTLPAEQEFVSATGPTKETLEGQVVTFAPLKSLAPKAEVKYQVVVKGVKAGDVRFEVSLTSDQMDSPAGETESTHIYE